MAITDADDFAIYAISELLPLKTGSVTIHERAVSAAAEVSAQAETYLVSGSINGDLALWRQADLVVMDEIRTGRSRINVIVPVYNGFFLAGTGDGVAILYAIESEKFKEIHSFTHFSGVTGIAVTGGKWLVTASLDHRLSLWDMVSGKLLSKCTLDQEPAGCAAGEMGVLIVGTRQGEIFTGIIETKRGCQPLQVPEGGFDINTIWLSGSLQSLTIGN